MATFPTYSWAINQGSTINKLFEYRESDGTTPIDLTGYSARMQIRTRIDAVDIELELSTSNAGITIPTPTSGQLYVHMTSTQTAALDPRGYVYDIELYYLDGAEEIVTRLIEGALTVRGEVTR